MTISLLLTLTQAQVAQLPALDIQRNIVYRTDGEREVQADLFKPKGVTNPPLVVVIHGGAWVTGQRTDMDRLAAQLAESGFAAATVSYGLAPRNKWPVMIDDVRAAVTYFRTNNQKYGISTTKVGAAGASAGGHLALLLGTQGTPQDSYRVQCVLNIFGPTDLLNDFSPALSGVIAQQVIGKPFETARAEIAQMSPITFVSKDSAPVFTIHGDADTLVPIKQAERLKTALDNAGVTNQFITIKGMGHQSPEAFPEGITAIQNGIKFLKDNLQ